jgi:hypothetical protein
MGRRGLSRIRDFFMDRVTNRAVYLAREKSAWIIPWRPRKKSED